MPNTLPQNTQSGTMSFVRSTRRQPFGRSQKKHIIRLTEFGLGPNKLRKRPYIYSHLTMRALNDFPYEIWTNSHDVTHVSDGECEISTWDNMALVRITISETDTGQPHKETTLASTSYKAYCKLFQTIKEQRLGNLVRIWNYVPDILNLVGEKVPTEDRERYRQFNVGRALAWEDEGPKDTVGNPLRPAATGIGKIGGPLIIEALVSHNETINIDNPRQDAAFTYPKRYGTKAPAFSRGTVHITPSSTELYIAGTASILGSDTVHVDNPIEQTKETFRNIEALIGDGNLRRYSLPGFTLSDLQGIRVYIKNPEQYDVIRKTVEEILGKEAGVTYLGNEICRPDLLLEVEAIATKPTTA